MRQFHELSCWAIILFLKSQEQMQFAVRQARSYANEMCRYLSTVCFCCRSCWQCMRHQSRAHQETAAGQVIPAPDILVIYGFGPRQQRLLLWCLCKRLCHPIHSSSVSAAAQTSSSVPPAHNPLVHSVELAFAELNSSIGHKATAESVAIQRCCMRGISACITKNAICSFSARLSHRKPQFPQKLQSVPNANDPWHFDGDKHSQ